jgi:hypothetical protein
LIFSHGYSGHCEQLFNPFFITQGLTGHLLSMSFGLPGVMHPSQYILSAGILKPKHFSHPSDNSARRSWLSTFPLYARHKSHLYPHLVSSSFPIVILNFTHPRACFKSLNLLIILRVFYCSTAHLTNLSRSAPPAFQGTNIMVNQKILVFFCCLVLYFYPKIGRYGFCLVKGISKCPLIWLDFGFQLMGGKYG